MGNSCLARARVCVCVCVRVYLCNTRWKSDSSISIHILLKVLIKILEHQIQLSVHMQHFLQAKRDTTIRYMIQLGITLLNNPTWTTQILFKQLNFWIAQVFQNFKLNCWPLNFQCLSQTIDHVSQHYTTTNNTSISKLDHRLVFTKLTIKYKII